MNTSFNPAAKQEFAAAAGWYADQAGSLRATDFRNEVLRSLKLIAEHPNLGSPAGSKTRSLVVHRYPYSVIYRIEENSLRVLAIANHSRRPGYWAGRW
ncbi:MAG: type II toxin-antitoxin system RelE/ParE family toxin [Hydrogenophilaceae bacterium]|nr:type II toxin-antitoxin system RelE/ParE family toxin [Hydrogenophilaceae bacterium]